MKLDGMDAAMRAATAQSYYSETGHPEIIQNAPQDPASPAPPRSGQASAGKAAAADRHQQEKQFGGDEHFSEKVVREALDKANRILSGSNRKFEITFHEKTREVMVRVVNSDTNETIREIPPKKIVDIVVSLCEMAGIMFDQKG